LPFKGGPTAFQTVKAPLRDDAGNIIGICGIARDISELRQTEEALTRLNLELERRVIQRTGELAAIQARLHRIIANTPAVIVTADIAPPYSITFVSDYIHRLGFAPKDLMGTPLFDPKRVHPDDRSEVAMAHLRVASALETLGQDPLATRQWRVAGKNGTYRWVQGNVSIEQERGAPVEIVACWIDLTHQKGLEQKLEILSGPAVRLKVWESSSQTGLKGSTGHCWSRFIRTGYSFLL
jgi:PAS domain S-box-containing protein